MSHRIYVDEQLTPAEFDESVDYNILSALDRAKIESESHCRAGSAAPAVSRCCEVKSAIRAESRLGMCAKEKFFPVVVCRRAI